MASESTKESTTPDLATIGVACLMVILIILVTSYFFPITLGSNECYREIATNSCPENQELTNFNIGVNSFDHYDFQCCEPRANISRLISDNIRTCEGYRFLEEDKRACSKRYHHWKRVW